MKKLIISLTLILTLVVNMFSQDFIGNITSNFIWRGKMISDKISVQPILYFDKGDSILMHEVGTFSSFTLDGSYKEVDLYYKLTYKWLFVSITDYMFDTNNILNYDKNTTNNALEPAFGVKISNLSLSFNTFIWGADKDSVNKQFYSSYIEASYLIKNVNLFIGFTPYKSIYADKFSVVNIGTTFTKNVIIDKFTLPISSTLMLNPNSKHIFANLTFSF